MIHKNAAAVKAKLFGEAAEEDVVCAVLGAVRVLLLYVLGAGCFICAGCCMCAVLGALLCAG